MPEELGSNFTEEEQLQVLTEEKPLSLSFFGTDKGRDMLRRAYMSCQYNYEELAQIFNSEKSQIAAFITKQGWPAEREKSRKEGELAKKRLELQTECSRMQLEMLGAIDKALVHLNSDEMDGSEILESAPKIRALAQTIKDFSPEDSKDSTIKNAIINVGSQVVIKE